MRSPKQHPKYQLFSLTRANNCCLFWESYKNRQNNILTKIWTSCSTKNTVPARCSLPYLSSLFAEVPLFASRPSLSTDILLGRWCGDPSGQPTTAPCRSICNRTKKTVTVNLMWPSLTTDLHLRARLAQGTGRDVLKYLQILTVEVQVHCQGSHVKFLAYSVALQM